MGAKGGPTGAQLGLIWDKISSRHHHDSSRPTYDSPRSIYDQDPIYADLRRSTRIHPDFTATHPNLTTIYPDLDPIRANRLFPVHNGIQNHSLLTPVQDIKYSVVSRNPSFGSVAIFIFDINDYMMAGWS
jgi:hypothetical protein